MSEKLVKFGSVWLNLEKVINVQSRPPPPPPGLDRVKISQWKVQRKTTKPYLDCILPLSLRSFPERNINRKNQIK